MPDNQELHIGTVSKPVFLPSTTYNVRTSYVSGGMPYDLISPVHKIRYGKSPVGAKFVISRNGAQISDTQALILGQDYELCEGYLWLSDWSDPRCQWQIRVNAGAEIGTVAAIDMGYGPLPTNYSSQFYELVSPGSMMFEGNFMYTLLYAGSEVEPCTTAITMADGGNRSPILCTGIKLRQKFEPYSVITVDVSTTSYSAPNSPSGAAASIVPDDDEDAYDTDQVNGDMHGTVIMTETPVT